MLQGCKTPTTNKLVRLSRRIDFRSVEGEARLKSLRLLIWTIYDAYKNVQSYLSVFIVCFQSYLLGNCTLLTLYGSGLHSGYISESTLRHLCDAFLPNLRSGSASEAPPRRLQLQTGEKGGKTMAVGATKFVQNCSFNCKWQPSMEVAILKNLLIVLLIANGGPLRRPPFSMQNSFRVGRGIKFLCNASEVGTLNAAQVSFSRVEGALVSKIKVACAQ